MAGFFFLLVVFNVLLILIIFFLTIISRKDVLHWRVRVVSLSYSYPLLQVAYIFPNFLQNPNQFLCNMKHYVEQKQHM